VASISWARAQTWSRGPATSSGLPYPPTRRLNSYLDGPPLRESYRFWMPCSLSRMNGPSSAVFVIIFFCELATVESHYSQRIGRNVLFCIVSFPLFPSTGEQLKIACVSSCRNWKDNNHSPEVASGPNYQWKIQYAKVNLN
jgi:hypothetical protein